VARAAFGADFVGLEAVVPELAGIIALLPVDVVLVAPVLATGADTGLGETVELSALAFLLLWLLVDVVVVAVESAGAALAAPVAAGVVPLAAEVSLAADFLLLELFLEVVVEASEAAASVDAPASVPVDFLE